MTISKEKLELSTLSAGISLILIIAGVLGIFYNAKADVVDRISSISQRVATQEQKTSDTDARLSRIETKLDGILTSLRANPNY